jgi:hypothetical protein
MSRGRLSSTSSLAIGQHPRGPVRAAALPDQAHARLSDTRNDWATGDTAVPDDVEGDQHNSEQGDEEEGTGLQREKSGSR